MVTADARYGPIHVYEPDTVRCTLDVVQGILQRFVPLAVAATGLSSNAASIERAYDVQVPAVNQALHSGVHIGVPVAPATGIVPFTRNTYSDEC